MPTNSLIPQDYNVNITIDTTSAIYLGLIALGVLFLAKHL